MIRYLLLLTVCACAGASSSRNPAASPTTPPDVISDVTATRNSEPAAAPVTRPAASVARTAAPVVTSPVTPSTGPDPDTGISDPPPVSRPPTSTRPAKRQRKPSRARRKRARRNPPPRDSATPARPRPPPVPPKISSNKDWYCFRFSKFADTDQPVAVSYCLESRTECEQVQYSLRDYKETMTRCRFHEWAYCMRIRDLVINTDREVCSDSFDQCTDQMSAVLDASEMFKLLRVCKIMR